MARVKAVVDVGTNSVKLCLAEEDAGQGGYKIIEDKSDIARLGEGLKDTKCISPAALERNAQAAAKFVDEAKKWRADEVAVVGTMALREAENTRDFASRVKELCGASLQVLSGEEEARLSYVAVMSGLKGAESGEFMTMDTGGGSTEFALSRSGRLIKNFSLNVGSVRLTEEYLAVTPVPAEKLARTRAFIRREFTEGGVRGPVEKLIGMGGTLTTMAAVKHKMAKYDRAAVHGATLTIDDVRSQIADYASKTLEQRRTIAGLNPKRADVILAGACIVEAVLELTGCSSLTVSDRGLRHGLLYEMFK